MVNAVGGWHVLFYCLRLGPQSNSVLNKERASKDELRKLSDSLAKEYLFCLSLLIEAVWGYDATVISIDQAS